MEITNKTLAIFLVAAVAISLFGTILSINKLNQFGKFITTGYATSDNATATLVVSSTTSIKFAVATVDWGTGYVNSTGGYVNCTLTTNGYNTPSACVGFNTVSQGFVLENDGNTMAQVQLYSNATAAQFIGDSTALFLYRVSDNESNSCTGEAPASYTTVNTTSPGTLICPSQAFNFTDNVDSLRIDINVTIPYTAPPGSKSARLTATAS